MRIPRAMTQQNPRFSARTLQFIDKASRQKRVEWLDRNRGDYEALVLEPLAQLARRLKQKLGPVAPDYHFPQKGLGRLKRSANRALEYGAPFKDWLSYSASRPRVSRFDHNPNLYLLFQPGEEDGDEVLLAGGLYMPSSRQLRSIREALSVAANARQFDRLFATKAFKASFPGGFCNEKTATRPPRGFDPNHPRLDWLKLQAYFVWRSYTKREFASADFAGLVARDGAQILKMNELLDQAIAGRLARDEPKKETEVKSLTSRLEDFQAPVREMDF